MARDALIAKRRDTAANWTSVNPTLADGEEGYETDTRKSKVGDGSMAWNSLSYAYGANLLDSGLLIYYVTPSGSNSNNGKTWSTAFATIEYALSVLQASSLNTAGTIYLSDGTHTIASTVTVTRLQSITGQGAGRTIIEVGANGPGIIYTGVSPEVTPYSTTNYPNTGLKGFTIRPSGSAGTDTAGIKVQDIVFPQITDVFANGFTGVRGVGIWVFNKELPDGSSPGGFVERLQLKQVAVDNNTYGILLDRLIAGQPNGINDYRTDQVGYGGYGNTSTNADNSVMYHTWVGVSVNARAVASGANAQTGIMIQKGVQFYHASIGVQFNITGVNGANTVAPIAMRIQNSSAVNSGDAVIRGEASGTGATSIDIDDTSTFDCVGLIDFLYSSSFSAQIIGTNHNGNFKFSGGANGYGLTHNTTQATKPIHTIIEKTTLAGATNTAPPNGAAIRIVSGLLDSTHPAFDWLRTTNQRCALNSFDGTTTLTYLQALQDATKPVIQFPQGLRVMSGANMYSGSGAPNVTGSVAGDYYLRTDGATNKAQMLYVATGSNTWVPLGTYDPTSGVSDVNGNRIIGFTPVSSAVNYPLLQNNTTGNAVVYGAGGSDAAISVIFKPKGATGEVIFRPDTGGDSISAIKFNNAGSTVTVLDIDTSNGRVGIGNVAPTSELDVTGKVTAATFKMTTSPTTGYVLTATDGAGNMSWQSPTAGPAVTRGIAQTAHGLAVGNLVRHNGTGYVKSQADSAANAEIFGIVSAVADANNFTLTTHGYVTGLTGLTAGSVFFLDPSTAGAFTSTEPTAAGQISKPVILANSTTSGYFVNSRGITPVATERAATATLTNKTLTSPVINSPTGIVKADVGLGNVDNTSNATERAATRTLTNARVTPRTGTTTSSATPTINTDNVDFYSLTAQAADITSFTTNLSGTPTEGQKLLIRIKDNGTARAITWGASFVSSGSATLLATTSISKTHMVGLIYDAVAAKWTCQAVDAVGY